MLLQKWLELPYAWPNNPLGLLTGLVPIDLYLGGLQPGQLLMLCSYDDIAASSIQYSISLGVAQSAGVLFCTRNEIETVCREILCEFHRLSPQKCLRDQPPSYDEYEARDDLGFALRYPFEIDDRICQSKDQLIARLEDKIRTFQREHGHLGLVVLDGSKFQFSVAEAEALRELAQRYGITLCLSLTIPFQPFRERDPFWDDSPDDVLWGEPPWNPKQPILGDIEAVADVLMVLQLHIESLKAESMEDERLLHVYRRRDERWIWCALWLDASAGTIAYDHMMITPSEVPLRIWEVMQRWTTKDGGCQDD